MLSADALASFAQNNIFIAIVVDVEIKFLSGREVN